MAPVPQDGQMAADLRAARSRGDVELFTLAHEEQEYLATA